MTTYAKYRILLFSLELTDGKFLRVDNLEDGCSAIEAKAVFDEMRRTADVVDVGEDAGHRLSLVQEIDSFECRESLANAEGFPCEVAGGEQSVPAFRPHRPFGAGRIYRDQLRAALWTRGGWQMERCCDASVGQPR